jgi:hypothetical protein
MLTNIRLVLGKHSSLFYTAIGYEEKSFMKSVPVGPAYAGGEGRWVAAEA